MNPWMERAIQLGEKGRFTAPPNPWVGCVVVKNNTIVGEGFSSPAGGPHAEVHALKQAGSHAKGATLYVTLEPCCHHGRTPPCIDAILQTGIQEVIIGVEDPDSRVQGKGIAALKKQGITVHSGVLEKEVTASLRSYLHHRKTGLPYVVLKSALSLDGKIAAPDGTSQWLSSPESLEATQDLRAASQAILIGSGTALHDKPRLTVRKYPLKPLRVVIDRRGRLPPAGPLFDPPLAPTCIFTETPRSDWKNVEVITLKPCSIPVILKSLGERGILQLLVEGGASLFSAFVKEDLFQECELDIAPLFLGKGALSLMQLPLLESLSQSNRLTVTSTHQLGDTVHINLRR